ncbi:Mrp/NBP35 family ATP-binding protein [Inmirania thermothiophila]|uniref:Iron-sulfur cluster carrier protein n=1 Tax=Inmirania thermothiophila TaxID=1750597 RepID=A0A3N1XZF6_9GAMM|nr:Mrp/NBP35 family ATP-binding protein [Inmirania thermothiophila]ROR31970.1 ATP-binding protein involved in chromosome partitioning [Inmirania thermothiophila]
MSGQRSFPVDVVTEGPAEDPFARGTPEPDPIPGVEDVVLVASGKGGVGKSTVAANLACALARRGRRVGIVDADIYGPSVARMMGTGQGLDLDEQGRVIPAHSHAVWSVSVANALPPEAAVVWKGPLVAQAVMQMFREVAWPDLEILLVDLPPGTGDVQLTILEQVPVTGAVIVSTPQRLAAVDAERGIAMFHDLDIPVFGVVENMDAYVCPCCGERQRLFAEGGVELLARRRHVRYLGGIPLDPGAQELADSGRPLVVAAPESEAAKAFDRVAEAVERAVAQERRAREAVISDEARAEHEAFWEGLLEDEDD